MKKEQENETSLTTSSLENRTKIFKKKIDKRVRGAVMGTTIELKNCLVINNGFIKCGTRPRATRHEIIFEINCIDCSIRSLLQGYCYGIMSWY